MSSLISNMFSESKATKKPARSHATRNTRRSERTPAVTIDDNTDVPSAICIELSKRLLVDPDVSTGSLFKTARNANRPINQSDTVILVSACILDHLGHSKAATISLSRSSTVTKMYERMGLNNGDVRELFVTALFAINPIFVKMVESSVKISLSRLSDETTAPHSELQLVSALRSLTMDGSMSIEEARETRDDVMNIDTAKANSLKERRNSIQITPKDIIMPDDSASLAGNNAQRKAHNRSANISSDKDIMRFIVENKRKPRPKFNEEFPNEKEPVTLKVNHNREGLGSSEMEETVKKSDMLSLMSEILNSRAEGSNVPLTPSTRKASSSSESYIGEDVYSLAGEFNLPDAPSDITMRKVPLKKTRLNYSIIGDSMISQEPEIITERNVKEKSSIEKFMEALARMDSESE